MRGSRPQAQTCSRLRHGAGSRAAGSNRSLIGSNAQEEFFFFTAANVTRQVMVRAAQGSVSGWSRFSSEAVNHLAKVFSESRLDQLFPFFRTDLSKCREMDATKVKENCKHTHYIKLHQFLGCFYSNWRIFNFTIQLPRRAATMPRLDEAHCQHHCQLSACTLEMFQHFCYTVIPDYIAVHDFF